MKLSEFIDFIKGVQMISKGDPEIHYIDITYPVKGFIGFEIEEDGRLNLFDK